MGVHADSVIVELEARNALYNAQIANSERHFDRSMRGITSAAERAETRVTGAFRGIAAAAGVAFGAAAVITAARAFATYVDTAKELEAQLRLATRETGNFAQAQQDVRRIAQETRTGLADVAQLYSTLQRNSRELGVTQADVARITQTVTQSFLISGASASEAAGGLRQFLQGLQSGTLRGEELNSVLENAPRLARALADGLGVTIGQLREMGAAGQLSGAEVTRAILDASQAIDEEFRQIPVTFDQAMTQVSNAATIAFGAFDRGGEFSNALIDFAGTGEISFNQIERAAFETGRDIRSIFAGLSNVFDPMGEGAVNIFDYIRREVRALRDSIATDLMALQRAANDIQNVLGARFDFGSMSMVYPEQFTFGDRYRAGAAQAPDPWWVGASQQPWWATAGRQQPGRAGGNIGGSPAGGGARGGGSRRRGGGGGGGRAVPQARRSSDLEDVPVLGGMTGDMSLADQEEFWIWLEGQIPQVADELRALDAIPLPDFGQMLTVEDQERLESFAEGFRRDLSAGLADAIVYGRSLGDVLVQTFQRAAAAALEGGIFQLLTGQGFGGKGGAGGFMGWISSAVMGAVGIGGGTFGPGLKGFASGGFMSVGGRPGIDQNIMSINGVPRGRVGADETLAVIPNGAAAPIGARGGQTIVQQTIQVDARGAVMNDQFASMILTRANQDATRIAAVMGKGVLKAVPARLSQFNSDGA